MKGVPSPYTAVVDAAVMTPSDAARATSVRWLSRAEPKVLAPMNVMLSGDTRPWIHCVFLVLEYREKSATCSRRESAVGDEKDPH